MFDVVWTAREITALRDALRMSKPEFARRVGVTPRTLRLWENGKTTRIHAASQRLLHEALDTADPDAVHRFHRYLGDAEPTAEVVESQGVSAAAFGLYAWEEDDELKRRQFGKLAAAGAVALLAGTGVGRIGLTDAQQLRRGIAALDDQDQRSGGGDLVDLAVRELAKAKAMLDTCSYDTDTADAFASATGELAVMTGWLAYDSDRQPLARRCYADAMALGTEADDAGLISHTCLYAANQLIRLSRNGEGSPHRALQLIGRARDLMRGTKSGRMHVLIAVREAQAQAVLCDRAAFDRAITTAWREMDYAASYEPVDECPAWLGSVNHSEVAHHEARGLADFGDFDRSIDLLGKAVDAQTFERNAVMTRASSANVLLRSGDLRGAVEEARPILTTLHDLHSARTLRELRPIREAVEARQIDRDLRDEFDALDQKAITT